MRQQYLLHSPLGRKASYIQIQQIDLFKPAQYLCTHHNQLALLCLQTWPNPPATALHTFTSATIMPILRTMNATALLTSPCIATHCKWSSHLPSLPPFVSTLSTSKMKSYPNLQRFNLWGKKRKKRGKQGRGAKTERGRGMGLLG